MSYRSTTKDGIAMYGEGGEGSPVEFDPLGGNVGLSTPYIEPEPEPMPPFEPEYPTLQAFGYEDQMVVNGQRISCTLDGMAIGCGQAQSMLQSGSAIPASIAWAQNLPGFSFEYYGVGVWRANIPYDIYAVYQNGRASDHYAVPHGSSFDGQLSSQAEIF